MSKVVETVVVQLNRPRGAFPGRTCEGCYVVEDGVVTLTDREGKPALDDHGYEYRKKLAEGEIASVIAGRLTKELRLALREHVPTQGFDEPIKYFDRGKI
jgi:hypothetical protein